MTDPAEITIRCIDFETTGEPTETDPQAVCEVGWCDIRGLEIEEPVALLCNPGRPMPPEARAVHHIGDADLADQPPPTDRLARLMAGPPGLFVAHQADYERHFFAGGEVPWVCTYKVALRLWPDAPNHKLQTLRYFLDLDVDPALAGPAHRAGPDAYIGAALMQRILQENRASIEDMIRWSNGPALLPKITFGKHRGEKWEDVPDGYLFWIIEKSDLDRDAKANARHHLRLRGKL